MAWQATLEVCIISPQLLLYKTISYPLFSGGTEMGQTQTRDTPDGASQEDPAHSRRIVQKLRVVFRSIHEHSRWVEKQCGVSAAQLWAMWELRAKPGLRVSELSEVLSIHPSTASNMLDKLERKGLVRRRRGKTDHRVVRLYLTETGEEFVRHAPRPAQGALTDALGNMAEDQLQHLDDSLGLLLAAMKVRPQDAALRPLSDD
jgi:DNA-binding MarR family transcriptional regulator